ncbi:hypothetical protein SSX86_003496 [Deinandra increscens subsp. villosa]|uniref:CRIB domain-containing protein n=1 Tax=Deinandra increscens subsp. villosa TaxID=3103831 RepID=A0AAP0DHD1_9ASTR
MKDRMERLIILPFTVGCVSSSGVEVCIQHERRPKEHVNSAHTVCRSMEEDVKELPKDNSSSNNDNDDEEMVKGLWKVSKPNIYIGFHRLTRTIKTLSHSLVFKEEVEQAQEMEMEIGLPTDVKHVTHVGFDGPLTTHGANGCNHLDFSEFVSLCPGSVAQYEEHATTIPMYVTRDTQNTPSMSPDIREKQNGCI